MLIDDVSLGRIVSSWNEDEVILGIYWNFNSLVNYAYDIELTMYLVTYPYCDAIYQRTLNHN